MHLYLNPPVTLLVNVFFPILFYDEHEEKIWHTEKTKAANPRKLVKYAS